MYTSEPFEQISAKQALAFARQQYAPDNVEVGKTMGVEGLRAGIWGWVYKDASKSAYTSQLDPLVEVADGGWTPPQQLDQARLAYEETNPEQFQPLNKQEFESQGYAELGLKYDPKITRGQWGLIARRAAQKRHNDFVMSRASGGQKVLGVGAAIATGFVDPLNYVPFVGMAAKVAKIARLVSMLPKGLKAVKGLKALNPTLRAALVGAADATLGEAVITPALMSQAAFYQEDYALGDVLFNFGIAAGTGGLLGGVGGYLRSLSLQKKNQAQHVAYGQLSRGERPNLQAVLPNQVNGAPIVRALLRGQEIPAEMLAKLSLEANLKADVLTPRLVDNVLAHQLHDVPLASPAAVRLNKHLHLDADVRAVVHATMDSRASADAQFVKAFLDKDMTGWWREKTTRLEGALKAIDTKIEALSSQGKALPDEWAVERAQLGVRLEDARVRMEEADVEADFFNPPASANGEDLSPDFLSEPPNKSLAEGGPRAMELVFKARQQAAEANLDERIKNLMASGMSMEKAVDGFVLGTSLGRGGQDSLDNIIRSWGNTLKGRLQIELGEVAEKPMQRLKDKAFNATLFKVMWRMGQDLPPPREAGAEAIGFAKIFIKHKENLLKHLRGNGIPIGRLEGHVFAQTHDRLKLMRVGRAVWMKRILPLLDEKRTFVDPTTGSPLALNDAAKEEWLKKAYSHLINTDGRGAGTGLLERMAGSRKLHFASPEAFLDYNTTFGTGTPAEGIVSNLVARTEDLALIDRLGPDPDAGFDTLLKKVKKHHEELGKHFDDSHLRLAYKAVAQADDVADPRVASFFSGLRAVINMSRLGKILLSSVVDTATVNHVLAQNGVGLAGQAKALLAFLPKGEAGKRMALQLGVGVDGMLSHMHRFSPVDNLGGKLGSAQNAFFKISGIEWWNSSMQQGLGLMLSNHLARHLASPWAAAPKGLKKRLSKHGIGEQDWGALKAGLVKDDTGREFITADGLRVGGFKGDLPDKLATYFVQEVDTGVMRPGARARTITSTGLKRGAVRDEIVRSMFQFKSFAITLMQRIWAPIVSDFNAAESMGERMGIIFSGTKFAITSTSMGLVSIALGDLATGKHLQALWDENGGFNANALVRAITKGGGLGVLGDVLVAGAGESRVLGLGQWLGGPALGVVVDVFKLGRAGYQAATGAKPASDLSAKALDIVQRNLPYGNLFFTQLALKHAFWYQLQEYASPGYTSRLQRRFEKQGREWWLEPTALIK